MDTLLLDRDLWDLCLNASGNIAIANQPYAIAQDVASAVRTFLGEVYYDTSLGIPYFQQILGYEPPMSLIKQNVVQTALTVPDVVEAKCLIASFKDRNLVGLIEVIDTDGQKLNVTF